MSFLFKTEFQLKGSTKFFANIFKGRFQNSFKSHSSEANFLTKTTTQSNSTQTPTHLLVALLVQHLDDLVRFERLVLQPLPHALGRLPFGDLLALALADLAVLQDGTRDRELSLVGQAHLHFGFVRWWWPAAGHAHFLEPADRVAGRFVVTAAGFGADGGQNLTV